jgi:hypothetical protein
MQPKKFRVSETNIQMCRQQKEEFMDMNTTKNISVDLSIVVLRKQNKKLLSF